MKTAIVIFIFVSAIMSIAGAQVAPKADARVLKYYTQEEFEKMTPEKKQWINYVFQESFVIPDEFSSKINVGKVDTQSLNWLRLPNERVKVYFSDNTPLVSENAVIKEGTEFIWLKSKRELDQQYEKIRDASKTKNIEIQRDLK